MKVVMQFLDHHCLCHGSFTEQHIFLNLWFWNNKKNPLLMYTTIRFGTASKAAPQGRHLYHPYSAEFQCLAISGQWRRTVNRNACAGDAVTRPQAPP